MHDKLMGTLRCCLSFEDHDTKSDEINRCLEGIWPSMHHLTQLGLCEAPLKLPPVGLKLSMYLLLIGSECRCDFTQYSL